MKLASLPVLFTIALVTSSHAQVRPELTSLVKAENDFARMSIDQNIRAAFVANFDDQTIGFRNGEAFLFRKWWLDQEANDAYLFWWPIRADVALSGDFGFTAGPAVRGGTQAEQKPTSGGFFASVWRKNSEGVWKVVADIGTAVYDPAEKRTEFSSPTHVPVKEASAVDVVVERSVLLERDKKYVAGMANAGSSFDPKHLSAEAWLLRPGLGPLTSPVEIMAYHEVGKFTLEQVGGDVAASGDMGFTYGRVNSLVIRDGKETLVPLCYMRVWKKEGDAWKVILDVIG